MGKFKRLIELIAKCTKSPQVYARSKGVKIGKGCFISTREFPSEGYLIEIGNYVRVAPETAFYTHGGIWSIRKKHKDSDLDHFGKIKIGDYTYIGERCMIMPGVTIGNNCIIGGGSVVTKNVPDGCMVAGNPAKFIGYTEDFYHRLKEKNDTKTGKMNAKEKKKYLLSLPETMFEQKPFIKVKDV